MCTLGVVGGGGTGRQADSNRGRAFLNPHWLTADLPTLVVRLGGPSKFKGDPCQDLHVACSRVDRESRPWQDACDFIALPTELWE